MYDISGCNKVGKRIANEIISVLEEISEYNAALMSSIKEIKHACNNVVLKTNPGLAQAVAAGIDAMNYHEILGCVAGDDTIIIVTRSEESCNIVSEKLSKFISK
jgi:transcriptional regulator of arginine metabolism